MASKSVGGFDLILGHLYNDGWFDESLPEDHIASCSKCYGQITRYHLQKVILAFGHLITKHKVVWTCSECLHEELVEFHEKPPKKITKRNFERIFAKLPKSTQEQLLKGEKYGAL